MELDWIQNDLQIVSPLSCIVIAEGLDDEGDVVHAIMMTEGMGPVDAAGLLDLAKEWVALALQDEVIRILTVQNAEQP
jgi:hypothetical protein